MRATPDFGRRAEKYDELRPVDAHWREVFDVLVREGDLLGGGRALDVGCGMGSLVSELAARGVAVAGVDTSPEMLDAARRKAPGAPLELGRAEALPFPQGSFDRVVLQLAVHLVDRALAFSEARRVLLPRGLVVIVTFDRVHFARSWLSRLLPSLEAVDRTRFPTEQRLRVELDAAGFRGVRVARLHQEIVLGRDEALRRLRGRHISTFDLIDPGEFEAGLARAERELADRVTTTRDYLFVTAER